MLNDKLVVLYYNVSDFLTNLITKRSNYFDRSKCKWGKTR